MGASARLPADEPPAGNMNTSLKYVIDAVGSEFTVRVFAGGLLSAFGHSPTIAIRDFSGEAQVKPGDLQQSWLKLTIRAASLAVKDDISDKDRREMEGTMQDEVLETSSYPEIVYECSKVAATKRGDGQYSVTLDGDLTMHGVTHTQTVPARVVMDGDTVRAFGNFSLLQTDYEMKLASAAGGALKVKDELKFSFNILARKKE
jgi:polyisoprenoid-binding protein YceI